MNALYLMCGLGVASLIAEILNLKRWLIPFLIIGIAVTGYLLYRDWSTSVSYFNGMVVFDNVALSFSGLIAIVAVFWFWLAYGYFHEETHVTDQAALVLFVAVGGMVLASYNNMAMLFLGIEILSLSLYTLAGSRKESLLSNEAAFKYFLMGSFATGFMLMGIALIYGATGFFHLDKIAAYATEHATTLPGFFYAGVLLVMVGVLFKISAVPFHFWAPDVYEGSPTVITALMSTLVKVAAFAALFRLIVFCFTPVQTTWAPIVVVITALTLIVANVTAVYQSNVKRMLAYSSVGHAGYILLALLSGGTSSIGAIIFYLSAYSVSTLAAFGVLTTIEFKTSSSNANIFDGLYKRNPFLAVVMTLALLSLAGIPPLAGFLGKYLVFTIALQNGHGLMVLLGVATSLIGVFYYFRVIIAMYFNEPAPGNPPVSISLKVLLTLLSLLSLALGIFPDFILLPLK
jgi:NADH-quinone oxidoreductase subunit N